MNLQYSPTANRTPMVLKGTVFLTKQNAIHKNKKQATYGYTQTWVFGRYFLEKKEGNLSLLGKQLKIFVDNTKISDFKQTLKFWETCIHHHEFDSFPIVKYCSNEIVENINKCDLRDIVSTFG